MKKLFKMFVNIFQTDYNIRNYAEIYLMEVAGKVRPVRKLKTKGWYYCMPADVQKEKRTNILRWHILSVLAVIYFMNWTRTCQGTGATRQSIRLIALNTNVSTFDSTADIFNILQRFLIKECLIIWNHRKNLKIKITKTLYINMLQ